MRPIAIMAVFAASALPVAHALAADVGPAVGCTSPCFGHSGTFDLNAAWLHPSDGAIGNSFAIGFSSETDITLKITGGLSFIANIITEPVIDAEPIACRRRCGHN